jgi:Holliday junction DNA helicase RuvA
VYEYIKGHLEELTPAYAVVELNGIGYFLNISLNTYSKLTGRKEIMLYLHYIVREDAQIFYGFLEKSERELFRLLISVSGIGANTARMILSSMSPDEAILAISSNNVDALKAVKGIGVKTAQRVIIELRDKISTDKISEIQLFKESPYKEEAASALVMLGFSKTDVNKVIDKLLAKNEVSSVGALVKLALKQL